MNHNTRNTLIVISGYVTASLTGFLRQAVFAHQVGIGRDADIFLVAFAIPEFMFIAFPIILYPAFIPLFTESRHRFGDRVAWGLVWRTAIGLLLLLLMFSLLMGFGGPVILKWLSPGFSVREQEQTIRALQIMLPSICFMGLAYLFSALLQIYEKFALPAFMVAVYNITFAISIVKLPYASLVEQASWAVNLGACTALLFQGLALWLYSRRLNFTFSLEKSPIGLRQVLQLAIPLTAGYAAHHIILLIDRAMATTLQPGSVAALNYANHLALVISQISGMAVSTVLFPLLAKQMSEKDLNGARNSVANAVLFVWQIAFPATVGLIILRTPIISVIYERGIFDELATSTVSAALIGYSLATLADAICQPFWRVIYTRQDTWTVFGVNGLQTIVRLIGNIILVSYVGYIGLAFSAMLGLTLQAIVLGTLVYRGLGSFWTANRWRSIWQVVYRTALAVVLMLPILFLFGDSPFAQLIICGTIGGGVYILPMLLDR